MAAYKGGVLSHEVPDGRAGADISLSANEIAAVTRAGNRLTLDPSACTVELGGASGRMWFCRGKHGDLTIYSEADDFGAALRGVPQLRSAVMIIEERQRQARRQRWALTTGGVLLLALVLVGGYFGMREAGRKAVLALPESTDEKLGEFAIASMDLGGPVVDDKRIAGPVKAIVARLSEHDGSEVEYNVRVVEAPVTNAFALPGGEIVVYTGLLRVAPSADAVAGVLAHEMGHVIKRHGLQRIAQSVGVAAAIQILVGDVSGVSALLLELMHTGTLTSYGRDQEREADTVGLHILHDSGIAPESLSEIFRILQKEHGDVPSELSWLSTHPELEERIATVEAEASKLGPYAAQPLAVNFAGLRDALDTPLKDSPAKGDDAATPSRTTAGGGATEDGN